MNGIYTGITPRNVSTIWTPDGKRTTTPIYSVPPGRRTFEFLFEPLNEAMRPLHWWDRDGCMGGFELGLRMGWENGDSYGQAVSNRGPTRQDTWLFPAGTFPEYADCVVNDWAHFVGLDPSEGDPLELARHLDNTSFSQSDDYYAVLSRTSPVCFFCVDGFVWEVYARDEALLQSVTDHLKATDDWQDRFYLQFGTIHNRDNWYYQGG